MTYETIKYERKGRIAYITLNRPDALNAFNSQLDAEVHAAYEEYDFDDEAWVAIIHGNGRCFSAGADVKQRFVGDHSKEWVWLMSLPYSTDGYLARTANWKPVIAAVHSYCLGAGLAVALECDLIVASEDAKFGITETKRGVISGRIYYQLHTFMPSKVSNEALLTGDPVPAPELHRLGLLNRMVPVGKHLEAAEELAQQLLKAPPLAVRAGVRVSRWPYIRKISEASLIVQPQRLHFSEDFKESSQAFVEKRQPVFHGR